MTDKLRDPLLVVMNLPTHRETLFGMAEGPALYEGQRLYLKRSEVLAELAATLAAAPQPAPEDGLTRAQVGAMLDAKRHDRAALVGVISDLIHNAADAYIEEHDRRAIADALLARGLRLAGGETMAWGMVRKDGEIIAGGLRNKEAASNFAHEGERIVRVAIRVVEEGDE